MLREKNQAFKVGFILLDFVLVSLSFAAAFVLHFVILGSEEKRMIAPDMGGIFAPGKLFGDNPLVILIGSYLYLGALLSGAQILTFMAVDLYHPRRGLNPVREVWAITRGTTGALILVLAFLFFYRGVSYSRLVIIYTGVFSILATAAGHLIFRRVLGSLRARGYNTRNVLILGTGSAALRFLDTLSRHTIYGYRIVGLLGARTGVPSDKRKLVLGAVKDLPRIASRVEPDLIVYAMPIQIETLRKVIEFCDTEGIDCRIVPDMLELITARARIEDMDGIPILTVRDVPLQNGYNRFVKRVFDILFSGAALIALSPLMLLLAILVKATSRGPVFFRQERIGLDRRIFSVYKFRSMTVQDREKSDTTWGSRGDSRVTPIGAILRKTSLDELPQFVNVFLGQMSVVGPRPERPHFVKQFKSRYAHYMRRHSVKSGITGWAQIQGLRGDTSIPKRVEADIYYIENWSLWLDIVIIMKTLPAVLTNPGE